MLPARTGSLRSGIAQIFRSASANMRPSVVNRIICLLLLASTLAWTWAQPVAAAPAKRVALVIGNANYAVKPLQNPKNDAAAIAGALTALGFDHVTLKTDLSRRQMVDALQAFEPQASGADVAVVFYAGHGTALEQIDTFLVPVDAKLARAADLEDEAVSLKSVLRRLDGTTGLRLVILDACRNPPFPLAGPNRSTARGLGRIDPDDNTLVVYATKDGGTADDGAGRHSPFTTALLNRLASSDLDVSFLFRHVRDDVMAATDRQQQPYVYGTLGATPIYLNQLGKPAVFKPVSPISIIPDVVEAKKPKPKPAKTCDADEDLINAACVTKPGNTAVKAASLKPAAKPAEALSQRPEPERGVRTVTPSGAEHSCGNQETSCSAALAHCQSYCSQRGKGNFCRSDCDQAVERCRASGVWRTTNCHKTGMIR
jgi:Caspase domain